MMGLWMWLRGWLSALRLMWHRRHGGVDRRSAWAMLRQLRYAASLEAMPLMMREVLLLWLVDGYSIDAIAEDLALPRAEVKAYLASAIERLTR